MRCCFSHAYLLALNHWQHRTHIPASLALHLSFTFNCINKLLVSLSTLSTHSHPQHRLSTNSTHAQHFLSTHSLIHALTHVLTNDSHTTHSLIHSFTHSLIHSFTHSLTHAHTHVHTQHTLLRLNDYRRLTQC